MLIQHLRTLPPSLPAVKKTSQIVLSGVAICTAMMAPNAFATDSMLVDKVVSVKFRLSDLDAGDGTRKVYEKLVKRATSFCRADWKTLSYLKQDVSECAADLVEQFVENAKVDELITYHSQVTSTSKTVQLASAMP